MRFRSAISAAAALCAATAAPVPAAAQREKLIWDLLDVRDTLSYTLRRPDGTGDLLFFAACSEYGRVDLRLGAPLTNVPAAGAETSVVLTANRVETQVKGVSEVYQPTGNIGVFAKIDIGHPVFALLATGRPLIINRPGEKPETWPAPDAAAVRHFVETCRVRSEH